MGTIKKDVIAKKLKHHREKQKKSQLDVSNATGITIATLSNYENGKSFPTCDNIILLCNYLNITPNDLFYDEPNIKIGSNINPIQKDSITYKEVICTLIQLTSLDNLFEYKFVEDFDKFSGSKTTNFNLILTNKDLNIITKELLIANKNCYDNSNIIKKLNSYNLKSIEPLNKLKIKTGKDEEY